MATTTRTGNGDSKTRDTTAESKTSDSGGAGVLASQLGLDRLFEELQDLGRAMADRGISAATDRVDGLTHKVTDKVSDKVTDTVSDLSDSVSGVAGKTLKNIVEGDSSPTAALKAGVESVKDSGAKGVSSIMGKLSETFGGGSKNKDKKKLKFINFVEELDLPVPRAVAYEVWTQFEEFPNFMKKVESVEQKEDETVEWKAQVFWSHRSWTSEIIDQVPNERIVWRSKGEKGHVDGAVTFHELTPDLTRMLVNLEYYPQGFFERTGNLWRAQGRRARLELKYFRRYLTHEILINQDDVEGWQGEIHDGEVAEQSSENKDQGSARKSSRGSSDNGRSEADRRSSSRSSSDSASKRPAKKTAPSASASSRSRATAKKATSSGSSQSRPRTAAKKSSSGSTSSSRGSRAGKSTSSSSRSRS
jgi:uncharacterized membrane protein